MKKFVLSLLFVVAACDLQPKITALPDTVGEFISSRYPTLLADPNSQPEIYNSAATDYGVYASPEIYGAGDVDDYVLYSSVDDYIVPPQPVEEEPVAESVEQVPESTDAVNDEKEDDILSNEFESDDVLSVPDKQQDVTEKSDNKEPQQEDDIAWDENANTDDKLNVPEYTKENDNPDIITVARGDTLYVLAKKYDTSVDELAKLNDLKEPYKLLVGQKLRIRAAAKPDVVKQEAKPVPESKPKKVDQTPKEEPKQVVKETVKEKPKEPHKATTTRVDVNEIIVEPGDTLYSLSRRYSIPVNDLAVMNNLSVPFALYAGQKLKVPDLASAPVRNATKPAPKPDVKPVDDAKTTKQAEAKDVKPSQPKKETKETKPQQPKSKQTEKQPAKQPAQKQKADAKKPEQKQQKPKQSATDTKKASVSSTQKKTPTIAARSSSKFSWPVRGKILSNYGAKTNGLFNDGINIAGTIGAAVLAAENGVVAYAGNEVKGMGNLVIIQHSDGWMTVYAHMDSMNVRRGTRVSVGQKIGTIGKTGKVDKPQLHFEVRKGTRAYNPIQYLKK